MDWVRETESQYLSAKDLSTGIVEKKIVNVIDEEIPVESGTIRHVLVFVDGEKKLILNKTNMSILIEAIGKDDFDPAKLVGKTVSLMKQKVSYQGDLVDGIRILKVE